MMVHTQRPVPRQTSEAFCRLLVSSEAPSKSMEALRAATRFNGVPFLAELWSIPQDSRSHPEGNVWVHTLHCMDALAACPDWKQLREEDRLVTMLATLLHDIGKITTTRIEPCGKITSHGHARAGVPMARIFLESLGNQPEKRIRRILPLIAEHMAFRGSAETIPINETFVAALQQRLQPANLSLASLIWYADAAGRPPRPRKLPERAREVLNIAAREEMVEAPKRSAAVRLRDAVQNFMARWQSRLDQRLRCRPVTALG